MAENQDKNLNEIEYSSEDINETSNTNLSEDVDATLSDLNADRLYEFVRDDLKYVAETTSLFDSIIDLKKAVKEQSTSTSDKPKVYRGRKYNFILNPDANIFYNANSKDVVDKFSGGPSNPISKHINTTVANGIEKGLAKNVLSENTPVTVWQTDYRKLFKRLVKIYPTDDMPQVEEFFTRFANAIMFELSRNTKSHITASARIKSQFSFLGKIFYRSAYKNDKPVNDLFGMKLILHSTDEVLPSDDPLMQKKLENDQQISEFQKTVQESLTDIADVSSLNIKTSDYYNQFIKMLDSIKKVVSPEATAYMSFIDSKKDLLQSKLDKINALGLGDSNLSKAELQIDHAFKMFYDPKRKYKSDFEAVLARYKELNDDLVYYPIFCNQVRKIFTDSKVLQRFNFKVVEEKNKDNENGYRARFIVLETPVGRVEIQLQTENQLRDGISGFSAHDQFKAIPPLPILPPKGNTEKWNDFIDAVDFITPFAFSIEEDSRAIDETTMITTYDSRHLELKKVIEVSKESPLYTFVNKYLFATYQLLREPLNVPESLQLTDITNYLNSDEFKALINKKEQAVSNIDTSIENNSVSETSNVSDNKKQNNFHDDGHGDL